jgi:hypothetical protein
MSLIDRFLNHSIHITTSLLSSLRAKSILLHFQEIYRKKKQGGLVETFAFNQSSSYITRNIMIHICQF